jgi:uncharacterized protein (TIGR02145 family)
VSLKQTYGILYNWYAIDSAKICPEGFHIPSDVEWTELEVYLQNNEFNYDGLIDSDNDRVTQNKIAKALASAAKWVESDYHGSVGSIDYEAYRNKTGLSLVPGGYRNFDGTFHDRLYAGYWWTSTESSDYSSWNRYLSYNYSSVYQVTFLKNIGSSVCCVMDAK